MKEYELDRERNKAKQKAVLPESGKWGLFLLMALSRQFNDPNGNHLIHSWGRKQDSILLCWGKSIPTNPFALSVLQTAKADSRVCTLRAVYNLVLQIILLYQHLNELGKYTVTLLPPTPCPKFPLGTVVQGSLFHHHHSCNIWLLHDLHGVRRVSALVRRSHIQCASWHPTQSCTSMFSEGRRKVQTQ